MDSRGDVYQLNFTAPFHVEASGSVARSMRGCARAAGGLRRIFALATGQHVLSFSPELFFRIENDGLHGAL